MPEVLEVELARRAAAAFVGRRVERVLRTDDLVVAPGVDGAVGGARIDSVGRHGKVLVVATDGPVLGLHFGMTGRLLRDDAAVAIERLAYGSRDDDERWDRWVVGLDDGSRLRFHDPRRLGRIWPAPDLSGLGPDVMGLTRRQLTAALAGRRAPAKAVLLDQGALAGLGNMLADEVLWWAGVDPRRPAASLDAGEVGALQQAIRRRLPVMLRRGGSHTGTLDPSLRAGGLCPRDGCELSRAVVGGRTTVWCGRHQH